MQHCICVPPPCPRCASLCAAQCDGRSENGRGPSVMRICSFRHPARHPGDWHSRQAMPSGSKGWTQREPPVSIQARQAVPAVRQQPAEQPDPAARRALTRQPASKLAVRPAPSAAGRPVLLPRNLIMNKQAWHLARLEVVKHLHRTECTQNLRPRTKSVLMTAARSSGDHQDDREAAGLHRTGLRRSAADGGGLA